MIKELIDTFDKERMNCYDALANDDEPAWEKSIKKLKVIYKKIQIEMDSLDYPTFDTIEKLSGIKRMMALVHWVE